MIQKLMRMGVELYMSFVSNKIMEELVMKDNKLSIKVIGGYLTAEVSADPEHPGISISFEPDCGGGNTELALVEETDKRLVLRSWMDVSREDPDSYYCKYDAVLLSQAAYGLYCAACMEKGEAFVSMQVFAETLFYDAEFMGHLLPESLFQAYQNVITSGKEME